MNSENPPVSVAVYIYSVVKILCVGPVESKNHFAAQVFSSFQVSAGMLLRIIINYSTVGNFSCLQEKRVRKSASVFRLDSVFIQYRCINGICGAAFSENLRDNAGCAAAFVGVA